MFYNTPLHTRRFIFSALTLILVACSTQRTLNTKGLVDDQTPEDISFTSQSYLAMPLNLKWTKLGEVVNREMSKQVYKDASFDGDNLLLNVEKVGDLILSGDRQRLRVELPLKISGTYRYGANLFGVAVYDQKPFVLSAKFALSSSLQMDGWNAKTQVTLDGIKWLEKPTIFVGGQPVNITFLVESAVKVFKKKLEAEMSTALSKGLQLQQLVAPVLDQASKPISLGSENPSWVQIQPLELQTSQVDISQQSLNLNLGMKFRALCSIGKKPAAIANKNLVLNTKNGITDQTQLALGITIDYTTLSELSNQRLKGQRYQSGKKEVTITQIDIYPFNNQLVVATHLTGSLIGVAYVVGTPKFDSVKQEIYIDQINFQLDTKNKLAKSAAWLLKSKILDQIRDQAHYSVSEELQKQKVKTNELLSNYSLTPDFLMQGKINTLNFEDLKISKSGVHLLLMAQGQLKISTAK